jgi:hypothetical protein
VSIDVLSAGKNIKNVARGSGVFTSPPYGPDQTLSLIVPWSNPETCVFKLWRSTGASDVDVKFDVLLGRVDVTLSEIYYKDETISFTWELVELSGCKIQRGIKDFDNQAGWSSEVVISEVDPQKTLVIIKETKPVEATTANYPAIPVLLGGGQVLDVGSYRKIQWQIMEFN